MSNLNKVGGMGGYSITEGFGEDDFTDIINYIKKSENPMSSIRNINEELNENFYTLTYNVHTRKGTALNNSYLQFCHDWADLNSVVANLWTYAALVRQATINIGKTLQINSADGYSKVIIDFDTLSRENMTELNIDISKFELNPEKARFNDAYVGDIPEKIRSLFTNYNECVNDILANLDMVANIYQRAGNSLIPENILMYKSDVNKLLNATLDDVKKVIDIIRDSNNIAKAELQEATQLTSVDLVTSPSAISSDY